MRHGNPPVTGGRSRFASHDVWWRCSCPGRANALRFQAKAIVQVSPIQVTPTRAPVASSVEYTFSGSRAKNPNIEERSTPEDPVKLLIRDVKSVMVALQLFRHTLEDAPGACVGGEVDGEVLVDRYLGEAPFGWHHHEAEDLGETLGRGECVLRRNDQVVLSDRPGVPLLLGWVL